MPDRPPNLPQRESFREAQVDFNISFHKVHPSDIMLNKAVQIPVLLQGGGGGDVRLTGHRTTINEGDTQLSRREE